MSGIPCHNVLCKASWLITASHSYRIKALRHLLCYPPPKKHLRSNLQARIYIWAVSSDGILRWKSKLSWESVLFASEIYAHITKTPYHLHKILRLVDPMGIELVDPMGAWKSHPSSNTTRQIPCELIALNIYFRYLIGVEFCRLKLDSKRPHVTVLHSWHVLLHPLGPRISRWIFCPENILQLYMCSVRSPSWLFSLDSEEKHEHPKSCYIKR
jgi:hypothetical protein